MSIVPESVASEAYCYFTTIGRVTGNPHEIEIWFGLKDDTLYLLSGDGKSDWVKNLRKDPAAIVRVAGVTYAATARIVDDETEEMLARNMLADKYNERESDGSLDEWAATALVVGVDVKSDNNGA